MIIDSAEYRAIEDGLWPSSPAVMCLTNRHALKNTQDATYTYATCQSCGRSWKIWTKGDRRRNAVDFLHRDNNDLIGDHNKIGAIACEMLA